MAGLTEGRSHHHPECVKQACMNCLSAGPCDYGLRRVFTTRHGPDRCLTILEVLDIIMIVSCVRLREKVFAGLH
jgi:hypothetical protein